MGYQFDHAWHNELERLRALEATLDPLSQRGILATNPQPGWRCLEVGGGGGSIAEWLLDKVGSGGHVVATDVETKFLDAIEAENLQVLRHDIVNDELQEDAFDLIHVRAVLAHLPERDQVLGRLVDALRPGGWLVPVVADFSSVRAVDASDDDREFFDHTFAAFLKAATATGFDPAYGRRIGSHLRSHGLSDVHVEGTVVEWGPSDPLASLYQMTLHRLHDLVTSSGELSEGEYTRLQAIMKTPGFRGLSNTIFIARGRKNTE